MGPSDLSFYVNLEPVVFESGLLSSVILCVERYPYQVRSALAAPWVSDPREGLPSW